MITYFYYIPWAQFSVRIIFSYTHSIWKTIAGLRDFCYMQPGEADMKNPKWHQIFKIKNCPVERLWLLWEWIFSCHIITVDFFAGLSTVENDKSFSLNMILKDYSHFLELAHNCSQKMRQVNIFCCCFESHPNSAQISFSLYSNIKRFCDKDATSE